MGPSSDALEGLEADHDVTEARDQISERLQAVRVMPWAPGPMARLLRTDARTMTGRRLAGERSTP